MSSSGGADDIDVQLLQWAGALDRDVQLISQQVRSLLPLIAQSQKNELDIEHIRENINGTVERVERQVAKIEEEIRQLQLENQSLREKDAAQQAQILIAGTIATAVGTAWIATFFK